MLSCNPIFTITVGDTKLCLKCYVKDKRLTVVRNTRDIDVYNCPCCSELKTDKCKNYLRLSDVPSLYISYPFLLIY